MFLSIDGLDGSGKSTVSKALAEALRARGREVVLIENPGDGPLGRTCRRLLTKSGPIAGGLAAAFLSLEIFLGALRVRRTGGDAIIVRYTLSALYMPEPVYKVAYRAISSFLPRPDLMVFVDVDPEIAMGRVSERGDKLEMFENRGSMERVRRRALAEPGVAVVDGSLGPDEVVDGILSMHPDALRRGTGSSPPSATYFNGVGLARLQRYKCQKNWSLLQSRISR